MATQLDAAPFFPALCFGKLPVFADFVRCNAGGRDVLAFDQWLQQGLFHARTSLGNDWNASYQNAPGYNFLFFPENSESFLLGLLKPSHDRSERGYPFIVCLRVDRRFPKSLLPLAPVLFASFLEGAARLVEQAVQGMSAQDIGEATDRLQMPVLSAYDHAAMSYTEHLTSTSLERVRNRLWSVGGEERVFLVFKNLLEVLLPLRGRNAARLAPGIRFPIPAEIPDLNFISSFWLDAAYLLARASSSRPFIFWTAPVSAPNDHNESNGTGARAPADAHLFLFLREPSTRSVLHFLRPDRTSDSICEVDIDGLGEIGKARASLPAQMVATLSAKDTTLRQLRDTLASPRLQDLSPRGSGC